MDGWMDGHGGFFYFSCEEGKERKEKNKKRAGGNKIGAGTITSIRTLQGNP